MENGQEIEEYIRKLAKEYFKKSIETELDSSIIFTYIKSLEDRINKTMEYIESKTCFEDEGTFIYGLENIECEELYKILKGVENDKEE